MNDSWSYTGNTGVWGQISVDEDLGLVYLPVELPTGDYYGGHRPGNGLFGESLVAVDLQTGKRKWHYQLVHHGIWDMDIPCAPILADITVNGRIVKAVAQPTKQAFLYVFDRTNGQPIWPIEERPSRRATCRASGIRRRSRSRPSRPLTITRAFCIDNLIDFTPELHAAGAAVDFEIQDRADLHAAGRSASKTAARHSHLAGIARRHELAGRLIRSGDAYPLCLFSKRDRPPRPDPAAA